MNAKTVQCPACGESASGNFCRHCGAPVMSVCPSCGAEVEPGSRACQECGTSLMPAASRQRTPQAMAPWAAIGIATVALFVALASWFSRSSGSAEPASFAPPMASAGSVSGQPPDLSSMTPREAADRLFNRVMTASESGNSEEALRFAPMALAAYDNLGALDNDARYHVALLHLATGDIDGARVQAEMLRQSVPKHLLAIMLEHEIAERTGKKDAAARTYRVFLAAYDAEMANGRAEYEEHRGGIERFRAAAQASAAKK